MKKILSLGTLALAGVFAFTGCGGVKDDEGKAWAEENGYVKYEDTFTSASVKDTGYAGMFEEGQALIDAMTAKEGVTTLSTINPDGSIDVAYVRFKVAYNSEDEKYYITVGMSKNLDGTLSQTAQNILREKRGTAYYLSHSFNEQVPTFNLVTGESAPTFEEGKYYAYSKRTGGYNLLTEEPADWATKYNQSYYTLVSTAGTNLGLPAASNVATSAKMYFKYVSHAANAYGGNDFKLEVLSFARAS